MSLEESINRLASAIEKLGGPVTFNPEAGEDSPKVPARREAKRSEAKAAVPTYQDVKDIILRVAEVKGYPAALEVLKPFNATHAKQLTAEQYGEALKAAREALAA